MYSDLCNLYVTGDISHMAPVALVWRCGGWSFEPPSALPEAENSKKTRHAASHFNAQHISCAQHPDMWKTFHVCHRSPRKLHWPSRILGFKMQKQSLLTFASSAQSFLESVKALWSSISPWPCTGPEEPRIDCNGRSTSGPSCKSTESPDVGEFDV